MKITKITLEDQGQDFLELYVSEDEVVIDAQPFQSHIWKGAMIPISDKSMVKVGVRCPIHKPPQIKYGFLNYLIEAIEEIEYKVLKCRSVAPRSKEVIIILLPGRTVAIVGKRKVRNTRIRR